MPHNSKAHGPIFLIWLLYRMSEKKLRGTPIWRSRDLRPFGPICFWDQDGSATLFVCSFDRVDDFTSHIKKSKKILGYCVPNFPIFFSFGGNIRGTLVYMTN